MRAIMSSAFNATDEVGPLVAWREIIRPHVLRPAEVLVLLHLDLVDRRLEGVAHLASRQVLDHAGQARPVGVVLGHGEQNGVEHGELLGHEVDRAGQEEGRLEKADAGLLGGAGRGADVAGVAAEPGDEALEGLYVLGGFIAEVRVESVDGLLLVGFDAAARGRGPLELGVEQIAVQCDGLVRMAQLHPHRPLAQLVGVLVAPR
jgi:hypothetical protein